MWHRLRRFLDRARGSTVEHDLSAARARVAEIRARAAPLEGVADDELGARAGQLRERARGGAGAEALLVESFALCVEAARRELGLRAYDTQLLAAVALQRGAVIEMGSGEGKTLAAVPAVALHAWSGRGVHVLTFNDYLARRDAEWMGPVYRRLGLRVGHVQEGMGLAERRAAYAADVTYATAKEVGFDLLRDGQRSDPADRVQRPFQMALVDEADSILIDEARVPLVIAGGDSPSPLEARRVDALVATLQAGRDHATGEYDREVYLTDAGLRRVEAQLGVPDLHDEAHRALLTQVNLALHARVLLHREVDYIVRDGVLELVDEFTGRVVADRRWPDGLHPAIEVKEGLEPTPDGTVLGSVTLQHFLRLYPRVCGMTATAEAAAEELHEFYGTPVVVIPPHRPRARTDEPDEVFATRDAKERAVVAEVARAHAARQPVLVGTASVAESERLAARLGAHGVPCRVLNARRDEHEAAIIAEAGAPGAVTISTNMAGRGTDIRLGGADEAGRDEALAAGGLRVIGTNRHESRRVDDQLRGRAGRQGDPGTSRFLVSLEDDLVRRYGIHELLGELVDGAAGDEPLADPRVADEIARAQRIIEGQHFAIRKVLWQYATMVEAQRRVIAARRLEVLLGEAPPLLREQAPERWHELVEALGEGVVAAVERQVALAVIDRHWADHLAFVADLREGLHLRSLGGPVLFYGGPAPLDDFNREITAPFEQRLAAVPRDVAAVLCRAEVTADGIDLAREGLLQATSTWTYLVQENPFGAWLERFFADLKKTFATSVR